VRPRRVLGGVLLVVLGLAVVAVWPSKVERQVAEQLEAIRQRPDPNSIGSDAWVPASDALVALGPKAVPALAKHLGDSDFGVRLVAARALAGLGDPGFSALRRALRSKSPEAKEGAASALGTRAMDLRGTQPGFLDPVIPDLITLLRDRDQTVVFAAQRALGAAGPTALGALAELLESPDAPLRQTALRPLSGIGEAGVPLLVEGLSDSDSGVRLQALTQLGSIGPPAAGAVPDILPCLADGSADARRTAIEALARIGARSPSTASSVASCTGDADSGVRAAAARAMGYLGLPTEPTKQALLRALQDTDEPVRAAAAQSLAMLGWYEAAIPVLREALHSSDTSMRKRAAAVLGEIGEPASAAVPELTGCLDSTEADIRATAACALARMGEEARPAVAALEKMVGDQSYAYVYTPSAGWLDGSSTIVGREAIWALGWVASTAPPELSALANSSDGVTACCAAAALSHVGREAVGPLVALLRTGDSQCRLRVAHALGTMGPDATAAVPALGVYLSEPDEALAIGCANALGAIGGPAEGATADLMRLLGDEGSPRLQEAAARALGRIGRPPSQVLPVLIACASSADSVTRDVAADALGRMGGVALPAVPTLKKRLQDKAVWVRLPAAIALTRLGRRDLGLPEVLKALPSRSSADQDAAECLAEAGGDSPEVLAKLEDLLANEDPFVRARAADGLGRRGEKARSAIPALRSCLTDEMAWVRAAAAAALVRLGLKDECVPVLLDALRDVNSGPVTLACEVLGDAGDTSVVPHLRALAFRSRDGAVVDAADKAIVAIGARPT